MDVSRQAAHLVALDVLGILYPFAQALDPDERSLELSVQRGAGGLDVGEHLEEFLALQDHIHGQKHGQDRGQRRHKQVELVPGQRRIDVAGRGREQSHPRKGQLPQIERSLLCLDLCWCGRIDGGEGD